MKIHPTDLDREAARLFTPAGGMRAGWRGSRDGISPVWERLRDGSEATPDCIDADDAATVGCMLAQVEAENSGGAVIVSARVQGMPGDDHCVVVHGPVRSPLVVTAITRGAALVAAMRALADERRLG